MAIDRQALVRRHNPVLRSLDAGSPLSVGNGEFAFTSDITGLQTFTAAYLDAVPLCTQSQWGWHSFPAPEGAGPDRLRLEPYRTCGRPVGYATSSAGQEELYTYLRQNPHRLNLAALGFRLAAPGGNAAVPGDLRDTRQELDLWSGILESRNTLAGVPLSVTTACHPSRDALSIRARSPICADGRLAVAVKFPYGSPLIHASDWTASGRHFSEEIPAGEGLFCLRRTLDGTRYFCLFHLSGGAKVRRTGTHEFEILPAQGSETLEAVIEFSPGLPDGDFLSASRVEEESARWWRRFWTDDGAIDLSGSTDPRWFELERRIVLSQYLTAIQCAGSLPPAETGLTCNSWYGKYHLEMHYWHAAHFPLWNRSALLERSLPWYESIRDSARGKAALQGYEGIRWPKMTAPDGRDSPSPIGPLLVWQQPHYIMMAELLYRTAQGEAGTGGAGTVDAGKRVLERYAGPVFETADFMASYAYFDGSSDRYVLGPPLIPAQENHAPEITVNPPFELEYWDFGLRTANDWRRRLGLPENRTWGRVTEKLSPLPVGGGVYLAHERCPDTFSRFNKDHPSMLAALGMLPGRLVDPKVMNATFDTVLSGWDFRETWGWDFPVIAMTAARLGRPEDAVAALLMDRPKNTYLANGHNPQRPKKDLPLYLPGNGAFLIAAACLSAGWDGSAGPAPGFPKDGSWRVDVESVLPLP